jgi:transcriptional regulator with XRE-family HTH domain
MTPKQCRAARALLDWSQAVFAAHAGVAPSTIRDFEKGLRVPTKQNERAMREAFTSSGVRFGDSASHSVALGVAAAPRRNHGNPTPIETAIALAAKQDRAG